MAIIGYARVSTGEQDAAAQVDALRANGCTLIIEDKASGGSRDRPNLKRAIDLVGKDDVLMVVRIDRLARSLSHLLEIIETLNKKGGHFRSINDPIDTKSSQGMLMTQMLGAFAEFERALIRERTKEGLKAAVARGAKPGNPKMRSRDPVAISELRITHKQRYLDDLIDNRHSWLPTVEKWRPHLPWPMVLTKIKALKPPVRSFSERTLVKACRALVNAGYADPIILETAPRLPPDPRIPLLVADRLKTYPGSSLRALAEWLSKDLREPAPRGGRVWSAQAVSRVVEQARKLNLITGKD